MYDNCINTECGECEYENRCPETLNKGISGINIKTVLKRKDLVAGKLYGVVDNGKFSGRIVLLVDIITNETAREMLDKEPGLIRQSLTEDEYLFIFSIGYDYYVGEVRRGLRSIKQSNHGYDPSGLIELSKKHERHLLDFDGYNKDQVTMAKAVKARLQKGFSSVINELAEILEVEDVEIKAKLANAPRLAKILEQLDSDN